MRQNDVFLILHGTGGNAPGHWQDYLAEELRNEYKKVRYPKLPSANVPRLKNWMPALEKELSEIDPCDRLTVVAHSRSCILWLHYAAQYSLSKPSIIADRVLLVAPPYSAVEPKGARPFFPAPLSSQGVANVAESTAIIASDDDEFATFEQAEDYASQLSIPIYALPSSGHISPASGYGDWRWVLRWCLEILDFPPDTI